MLTWGKSTLTYIVSASWIVTPNPLFLIQPPKTENSAAVPIVEDHETLLDSAPKVQGKKVSSNPFCDSEA